MKHYKTTVIRYGSDKEHIYISTEVPYITMYTVELTTIDNKKISYHEDMIKELKVETIMGKYEN